MSTSIRSDAVRRCRDAFEANKIPWDAKLERLPVAKLIETAVYWEKRHEDRHIPVVSQKVPQTIGQMRDLLSKMSGFPRNRGSGGLTPRQQRHRHRKGILIGGGRLNCESACGDGGMIS